MHGAPLQIVNASTTPPESKLTLIPTWMHTSTTSLFRLRSRHQLHPQCHHRCPHLVHCHHNLIHLIQSGCKTVPPFTQLCLSGWKHGHTYSPTSPVSLTTFGFPSAQSSLMKYTNCIVNLNVLLETTSFSSFSNSHDCCSVVLLTNPVHTNVLLRHFTNIWHLDNHLPNHLVHLQQLTCVMTQFHHSTNQSHQNHVTFLSSHLIPPSMYIITNTFFLPNSSYP